MDGERAELISLELFALLGTGRQIAPFSRRYRDFDLALAYTVAKRVRQLREAAGEKPIGRKIGFTNRAVWSGLGIASPIWNYVFDRTVKEHATPETTFRARELPEPRIEPEIVLHLRREPAPGMSEAELFSCLDWIAAGYEIVYSIFPGWQFTAADAAAAYGVHAALIIGAKQFTSGNEVRLMKELSSFTIEMRSDKGETRTGDARNVLGGPLLALRYLVEEIARYGEYEPLRVGELVATGTLTEAMPAVRGTSWMTHFAGIDLKPLCLRLC
jgi:2-keto-4-pentenoate hydratase